MKRWTLVMPAKEFEQSQGWWNWPETAAKLSQRQKTQWLLREQAEANEDYRQIIVCAVTIDRNTGDIMTFRRQASDDPSLSSKLSIVVGGHVEGQDQRTGERIEQTLRRALKRELQEEVFPVPNIGGAPHGMVWDSSTPASSRHAAIVQRAVTTTRMRSAVVEEFQADPNTNGASSSLSELRERIAELDPWSRIIVTSFQDLEAAK